VEDVKLTCIGGQYVLSYMCIVIFSSATHHKSFSCGFLDYKIEHGVCLARDLTMEFTRFDFAPS
jgi:hypothetical protein